MIAISRMRNVEFGMWNQRIELIPNSDTRVNHGDNHAPHEFTSVNTRRRSPVDHSLVVTVARGVPAGRLHVAMRASLLLPFETAR